MAKIELILLRTINDKSPLVLILDKNHRNTHHVSDTFSSFVPVPHAVIYKSILKYIP